MKDEENENQNLKSKNGNAQSGEPAQNQKSAAPEKVREATELEQKVFEYENDIKRLAAEFDNYRKRAEKEKAQARIEAQAQILHSLLTMRDEFDSALLHLDNSKSEDVKEGLKLLSKKLSSVLSSLGVSEVPASGKADTAMHEIVARLPGEKDGEIAQTIRKGYALNGRLLRPAHVAVYSNEKKGDGMEKVFEADPEELQRLMAEIIDGASPFEQGRFYSLAERLEKIDQLSEYGKHDPNAIDILRSVRSTRNLPSELVKKADVCLKKLGV